MFSKEISYRYGSRVALDEYPDSPTVPVSAPVSDFGSATMHPAHPQHTFRHAQVRPAQVLAKALQQRRARNVLVVEH